MVWCIKNLNLPKLFSKRNYTTVGQKSRYSGSDCDWCPWTYSEGQLSWDTVTIHRLWILNHAYFNMHDTLCHICKCLCLIVLHHLVTYAGFVRQIFCFQIVWIVCDLDDICWNDIIISFKCVFQLARWLMEVSFSLDPEFSFYNILERRNFNH